MRKAATPWARAGSGFTLLFEAYVLALAKSMPIANAAERLGEHDTRLWRIVEHYVWRAGGGAGFVAQLKKIGVLHPLRLNAIPPERPLTRPQTPTYPLLSARSRTIHLAQGVLQEAP